MKERISPNFAMRLNENDKQALSDLAFSIKRSQTDTIRLLVREGRNILPKLKVLAKAHPVTRLPGRPKVEKPIK